MTTKDYRLVFLCGKLYISEQTEILKPETKNTCDKI